VCVGGGIGWYDIGGGVGGAGEGARLVAEDVQMCDTWRVSVCVSVCVC
jgi:hypothetical protein